MKKVLSFVVMACTLLTLSTSAQVNKLIGPEVINWPNGWYLEGNNNYTLEIEEGAVKVVPNDVNIALVSKFQQRFTPSENGEYTFRFKAKKNGSGNQTIKLNITRTDAWASLTSTSTPVVIDSEEYKQYEATFQYNQDAKKKTAHGFQLEIITDGVLGNLWFKDIQLLENNNNLTAYSDDFETDKYYNYNMAGYITLQQSNNWFKKEEWAENNGITLGELKRETSPAGNMALTYSSANDYGGHWDSRIERVWWGQLGVQYRVQFDVSATTAIEGLGMELKCNTIIHATDFFDVTTSVQTVNFITNKATVSNNAYATIYAGKVKKDEKLYIDNFSIAPIYLYNGKVEKVFGDSYLEVSWLHSGYLAGDKLDVYLMDGETEVAALMEDIEIVEGNAVIDFSELELIIESSKSYTIKLKDKVQQGEYIVNNEIYTSEFTFPGNSIAMGAHKYVTFSAPLNCQISDATVYYASNIDNTKGEVTLTKIEDGKIPANEGVILESENATASFAFVDDATAILGNLLKGTSEAIEITSGYYLSYDENNVVGFASVAASSTGKITVASWKAYLDADAAQGAPRLSFVFDNGATNIDNIIIHQPEEVDVFSIDGRIIRKAVRVENATDNLSKGLYIVDGRKVAVK